ncbi:MAG TPA: AI-2E family transporter [Anaerolineales bacterium]|nr:AI-2E family transporter [Anaerolineales bacterium]
MKSTSTKEEVTTWTINQVVFATIFVVCVFLAFWLLYRLRGVVFLFFVGVVIGTAIRPGVEWLRRRGISRRSGIILIYILIAALLSGFLALTFPLIADQATQFSQSLPEYYGAIRASLVNSGNALLQNIGLRIPSQLQLFVNQDPTTEEVFDRVTQTFIYTNLVIKGILSVVAAFLLAYYWTQESNLIMRMLLRLLPPSRRESAREFLDLAETKMGEYVRGQALLSLTVGAAAFAAYTLVGLPYALVLSIIAGLMEIVPVFGPILGAVPALLVALSVDPGKAIWVLVATGVIQLLENAWLVPRIMNSSMGVNPIITLLALIAFSSVFGLPGALLAVPLAALIQLIVNRIVLSSNGTGGISDPGGGLRSLIEENQALLRMISDGAGGADASAPEISEPVRMEISSIAQELDGLLKQLENEAEVT